MINADHIIPLSSRSHSAQPPAIAVLFVYIPAVQGIAPKLPILRKGIRWAAGNRNGIQLFIQRKQLRITPYVC